MIPFPWYVPDEVAAEDLRAALAADWPEQAAEVRIGPHAADEVAVEWDGGTVRSWGTDGVRTAAAASAQVAVLFVRTWTLHPAAAGPERFLPAPLPEPDAWVPPAPPAPARLATDGSSGSVTTVAPPVTDGRATFAVGLGTRQSTDAPLSLLRGRLVLEAVSRAGFVDLAACAWASSDATRYVDRVHGGEQVVELALDRAALSLVGGWRRRGALPLYLFGGPELRAVEWQLYVEGAERGGVEGELVPALVLGVGAGRVFGPVELRALPYLRVTTAGPPAAVGLTVDALLRTRLAPR